MSIIQFVADVRIFLRLDKNRLKSFIMACQDVETGGFSDRPNDMPDPFHTLFRLAGLSLLGETALKKKLILFFACRSQLSIDLIVIDIKLVIL